MPQWTEKARLSYHQALIDNAENQGLGPILALGYLPENTGGFTMVAALYRDKDKKSLWVSRSEPYDGWLISLQHNTENETRYSVIRECATIDEIILFGRRFKEGRRITNKFDNPLVSI